MPKKRSARRRSLRLPASVLLLALTLVLGQRLMAPTMGAEAPAPSAAPSAAPTPRPEPKATPRPVPAPEPEPGPAPYDYTAPVPASDPVAEGWFDDAAFVGDSLTDGLMLYSGIPGGDNLAYKGITVQSARTSKVIKTAAGRVTPLEALGQRTYGKVYVLLGVNELGWYNDQRFYKTYAELIDLVRVAQPDAQIYLQTLLPVTAEKSASHDWLTNANVARYNGLIAELAREKEVYLLDTHASVADDTGALPAGGSSDGVHLTRAYYKLWLKYLETHAVTAA